MDIAKITELVGLFQPAGWQKNIAEANIIDKITAENTVATIKIRLPFPSLDFASELKTKIEPKILLFKGVTEVVWDIILDIATLARCNQVPSIHGVKNVIAIASGKGGVGKSTTTVNTALALAAMGAKVGIMDADIYGPSIPLMLGVQDARPESYDGKTMKAIQAHGLAVNSIGFIAMNDQAMIWRGPMASKALLQLIEETNWGELDYLFIDMPPGTGDIQLTLGQSIPVTGALVVTTPQDVALADAAKGISMFRQVNVPVLGVAENMSMHICSNCGHHEAIFGTGGAAKMAQRYDTECIAQLPLHIDLRADLDEGIPTVVKRPDSEFTAIYSRLANDMVSKLYFESDTISTEIPIKMA